MTFNSKPKPLTILLIDDDEITNFIHVKLLGKIPCEKEIIIKKDGLDALVWLNQVKALGESYPDHIFLDLNMPVMNGIELLNQILKFHPSLISRITVITAVMLPKHFSILPEIGISGVMQKPLLKNDLEMVLKKKIGESDVKEISM